MALTKNTLASATYIVLPNSTVNTFVPVVEGSVTGSQILPTHLDAKPGVFTAGTPNESTILRRDSNG